MLGSIKILTIALVLAFFASEALAQRDTFALYILPPGDESWILGTPYLKVGEEEPERLQMFDSCGWFKKIYVNEPIPEDDAWIWLGAQKADQVGVLGMKEDPTEYPDGANPTPINLKQKFDAVLGQDTPGKLYFFANEGDWKANIPANQITYEKARCEYNFAAIIYQRTAGNSDGFSWYGGNYNDTSGAARTNDQRVFGICKCLVKETLDENGKMQFNGPYCKNAAPYATNTQHGGNSIWKDEDTFNSAFRETEGKNQKKCWDMPFRKRPGGLWEFDAFYLCRDGLPNSPYTDYNSTTTRGCGGQGNTGGFYPGFGYNGGNGGGLDVAFTGQTVEIRETHKWCFDRGWSGQGGPGDLSNKTTREELDNEMKRVCGSSASQYPITNDAAGLINSISATTAMIGSVNNVKGGHLCFESQDAKFTYEPGQEFFFRGDDDIWVFINNQLVVDLGGTHMPAPGYVKLDTISKPEKLKAGEQYPIKIFFCDRRGTGSNVRISTNMYFSQKSGLSLKEGTALIETDICLESSGGGSCDDVSGASGPTMICGKDLGNQLSYYIQRRDGSGKIPLNANVDGCSQTGQKLKCFGPDGFGIFIDFANGQVQVLPRSQGIVGTWIAFAEIESNPDVAPVRLNATTGMTAVQVVWGKIIGNDLPITEIPYKSIDRKIGKEAVASKLIPVGFAEGAWVKDSSGTDATFEVAMDANGSPGKLVKIQTSSLRDANVEGSYLLAYADSAGTEEVDLSKDLTIPASGVLVLYFTGEFEATGTATYDINSRSTGDPFALKVHQPQIKFVDANNDSIPKRERIGSDPAKGRTATERWVYVGSTVSRKIAAFDPVDGGICTTCSFKSADIITDPYISKGSATPVRAREVIIFNEKSIKEGLGSLSLHSNTRIQFDQDSSAYFTVRGPSADPSTISQWDSLQFREPPVPYPTSAEIFDRNGDGIGDSIRIIYNRPFPEDTLPNMVQIVWSLKDTISFGKGKKDAKGNYTDAGIVPSENKAFWAPYLKKGKDKTDGDTIVIAVPYGTRESPLPQLSSDIKTAVHGVGEAVISWSTYVNDEGMAGFTSSFTTEIIDKIQPIIVSAEFKGGEGDCGTSTDRPCMDYVYIEISEPVEGAEGVANEAFAYRLLSKGETATFDIYKENKSLPIEILWRPPSGPRNFPDKDSSVRLTYRRYKTETETSDTPLPNDSVRLLATIGSNPLMHAFKDLAGNFPNPKEWGRRLEGRGPFSVDKNPIAAFDPADSALVRKIKDRFKGPLGDTLAKRLQDKPIGLLPVPEHWNGDKLKDSLDLNFPSAVGTVFWPGARATILDLDAKYGSKIPRGNIWFVANSFYHTSLGNYTAKSDELRIACDDDVFKVELANGTKAKDCTESENGLYLAWDLKDNKGRWAGTGAYVQVYNFYWEVKGIEPKAVNNGTLNINGVQNRYPSEGNKVEMFGVRRAAVKNK
jgi:fibro-slime domain-containing protein